MKRSAPPHPPRPGLQSLPPLPAGYWSRRESCGGGTHLPHPLTMLAAVQVKLHYAYKGRNLVRCIRDCVFAESEKCSADREYES